MISIAMFNNKGGVGKTTLTCNLASFFATQYKKRVIVIDCDPQCNATQLIMGEDFATEFYWNEENKINASTIRDILQPIEDGDSQISSRIKPILSSRNRFNVDLIAGHPGFSIIEDRLGAAWHDLLGGDIGGIRKTNWNTALSYVLSENYDFIFYDLGPSLGSINRCVLIGCEKFITPMGADIFSILGVKNIGNWISHWLWLYDNSILLSENRNPGRIDSYPVNKDPQIKNGYIGYTMQQYITKSKQGIRRPTKAYDKIISGVPNIVCDSLGSFFDKNMEISNVTLGDVPHLYSLIPLAQTVASPILDLQRSDGLVGAQYKQKEDYGIIVENISKKIIKNLSLELK